MAIESSFIPFPSEVVVPPAAYKAAATGELNVWLVIFFATVGAEIGALINYFLALWLGKPIVYKTGYQVATEGIETTSARDAINAVKAFGGNCGIWFSEGIYYIDKSHRVNTKREALEVGRACNQISVLRWRDMGLVYCA